jgi:hypothetical protein
MDLVEFEGQTISLEDFFESFPEASSDTSHRPWRCQFCNLINWPDHMDGTPRVVCHKCHAHKMIEEEVIS